MNFSRPEEEHLDVNITPLIDIVFLLLIFFMVTTTFNQQAELRVDLPESSSEEQSLEVVPIEITIDTAGTYFVNGQSLAKNDAKTLYQSFKKLSQVTKKKKCDNSCRCNYATSGCGYSNGCGCKDWGIQIIDCNF